MLFSIVLNNCNDLASLISPGILLYIFLVFIMFILTAEILMQLYKQETNIMDQFLDPKTDIKHQFQDPESVRKWQFLVKKTSGSRN